MIKKNELYKILNLKVEKMMRNCNDVIILVYGIKCDAALNL